MERSGIERCHASSELTAILNILEHSSGSNREIFVRSMLGAQRAWFGTWQVINCSHATLVMQFAHRMNRFLIDVLRRWVEIAGLISQPYDRGSKIDFS